MPMFRQLLLTIILTSILALVGSVVTSTLSARCYLVEQLRVKNQDNASALALSLSQISDDPIKLELAVAAQFDSGNYRLVRFTNAFDKVIVEKTSSEQVQNVPHWFIAILPMTIPAGNAKVSNGWTQLGNVTLESHSTYAYHSLWSSAVQMTLTMSIAALMASYLGALILRRIKVPLDQVMNQAQAISEKRFLVIAEPKVPELKMLAKAMNLTVNRLREIFEEEAKRLELARREANYDSLTGLPNRHFFMTQLREALHTEETAFGTCLILRVADLAGVNKREGRVVADKIIKQVAEKVNKYADGLQEGQIARLNGSDFALLIPADNALEIARQLMAEVVQEISEYYNGGFCASIGMAGYHKDIALGALMSKIDLALAAAEADSNNSVRLADHEVALDTPATLEGWAELIRGAIQFSRTYLLSYPVADFAGGILHREGPLRIRESDQAEWIPAGKFLSVAERLGLNATLDLTAVELGLARIAEDKKLPGYAINLSAISLHTSTFIPALSKLIRAHPKEAKKLWLELPEAGVYKYFEEFKVLCASLHGQGVKLGVEHFARNFDQINLLHDLGVNYVKVDASFIRDLDKNAANQSFLKGLSGIAHGIGMLVIAEGVLTEAEMLALKDAGFDGATGPAIKEV